MSNQKLLTSNARKYCQKNHNGRAKELQLELNSFCAFQLFFPIFLALPLLS